MTDYVVLADRPDTALGVGTDLRRRLVLVAWNVGYAVLLPVAALTASSSDAAWFVFAALGVLAVAQVALTAQVRIRTVASVRWWLVVAAPATALAEVGDPRTMILLIVVLPQVFALVDQLVPAVAIAFGLAAVGGARRLFDGGTSTEVALQTAFVTLTAAAVGWFTVSLLRETRARGALIAELQETRRQLADVHHDAGVRAENERMAREIHDTLAQGFTSLVLLLEAAEAMIGRDDEAVLDRILLGREIARENLAQARILVTSTPASPGDDDPLETAIERICGRLARELSIEVDFTVVGRARPLDANTYVLLMRSCQEALSNVRRHAGASHVRVTMTYQPHRVRLVVHDDGRGFDTAAAPGFGLRGMRSRAEELAGELSVTSTAGLGTTVQVEAP